MPLRISQVRMPLDGNEEELFPRVCRMVGLAEAEVESCELVRKSVDRRRRPELVYTLDLHLAGDPPSALQGPGNSNVRWVEPVSPPDLKCGDGALAHRPVVIGAGPAGLFAALLLARHGYRPRILERGSRMNERVRHVEAFHRRKCLLPESNYLFGEGGAGTFSDGKLTSRSKDPRARLVLDEFRLKSGRDSVSYYYRPHLGSDRIRAVVALLRREIESLGGVLEYGVRVDRLIHRGGRMVGVSTSEGDIGADVVICAPGHSARDFYAAMLEDGIVLEQKPFQMGFRVEHPQGFINNVLYGREAPHDSLGPADYRLSTRVGESSVFSFCMCPGGEIIPAVHDNLHFNTNGISYFRKDTGFANSGIVTTVEPESFGDAHPLAGIRLQERFEKLAAERAGPRFELPAQRLEDFMTDTVSTSLPETSCRSGEHPAVMADLVPPFVLSAIRDALGVFDRQIPGFVSANAVICGPESRSSSPVRIVREPGGLQALGVEGLFPVGEGAGYAGGIVSAGVDGWRAAEVVVSRFAPYRS